MPDESDTGAELARLRTRLDITHALLAAVSSTDPVRSLASRVSTLCHGTAIIYDFEGSVVASTGEAPVQLIWNEVSATNQRELALEIGRWHVRTRRVALRDGVHVIAIASRGPETLEQIGELLLDTSERLLGAVHGIQYGATQRDRRDNEQLIAALHDGILPAREHRFWSRLAQFRFPTYASVRAVELAPLDEPSASEAHIAQLVSRARSDDLPLLVMLRRVDMDAPATVAALVPASHASEQWLAAVDRIDLSTWLLSHVDPRQLRERIDRTLAPLGSQQLRDTLTTYLAAGQNVAGTAEALFLHPNTVRYRIGRVEEAIGEPLASPFSLSNLILALYPEIIGRRAELGEGRTPGSLAP
jgi:hypothetical protein